MSHLHTKYLLACLLNLFLSVRLIPWVNAFVSALCSRETLICQLLKVNATFLRKPCWNWHSGWNPEVKRNIFSAFNKANLCWLITANDRRESWSMKEIVNEGCTKGSRWTTHQKQWEVSLPQVWCAFHNAGVVLWYSVCQDNLYWEWS